MPAFSLGKFRSISRAPSKYSMYECPSCLTAWSWSGLGVAIVLGTPPSETSSSPSNNSCWREICLRCVFAFFSQDKALRGVEVCVACETVKCCLADRGERLQTLKESKDFLRNYQAACLVTLPNLTSRLGTNSWESQFFKRAV